MLFRLLLFVLLLHLISLPFLQAQNYCYSISSSSLTDAVCSGRGVCRGTNDCSCLDISTNNSLNSRDRPALTQGSYLSSSNGLYRLYLNMDGSLVYRTVSSNSVIKTLFTPTGNPSGPFVLTMQFNGIVELLDGGNKQLWFAGTTEVLPPYHFIVQSDGNIVIYDSVGVARWHADTHIGGSNDYLFGGPECNVPKCNGVLATETTTVCSGHGTCSSPNNCTCNEGWTGTFCQIPTCGGIVATDTTKVCSGHGTCLALDICSCNNGEWGGNYCQIPKCFGILANETTTVCSNHGNCVDKDKCVCSDGYYGNDCKKIQCYSSQLGSDGKIINSYSTRLCDKINAILLQNN